MSRLIFITHPEVIVAPDTAIEDWSLSDKGRTRAEHFACSDVLRGVTQLWSSAETKARETACIFARTLQLDVQIHAQLGENDRSATGFLPPAQFEAAADMFFAHPDQSFQGWETARAAQARIVAAIIEIASEPTGDIAIVSHGAVGALLFCHLKRVPIDRAHDQPYQGHYWVAKGPALTPEHGWHPIR